MASRGCRSERIVWYGGGELIFILHCEYMKSSNHYVLIKAIIIFMVAKVLLCFMAPHFGCPKDFLGFWPEMERISFGLCQ